MTVEQKNTIAQMRNSGYTYANIAKEISVSENTIKTYCRRARLTEEDEKLKKVCKQCSKPIKVLDKHKSRQFCSDQCRALWWYTHRSNNSRTEYHLVCANCKKSFVSIGNKKRKYCSHRCYISDRFGKGRGGDEQ